VTGVQTCALPIFVKHSLALLLSVRWHYLDALGLALAHQLLEMRRSLRRSCSIGIHMGNMLPSTTELKRGSSKSMGLIWISKLDKVPPRQCKLRVKAMSTSAGQIHQPCWPI